MALVAELWSDGSGTMQRSPGGWAYILRAIRDGEVVSQKEAHGGLEDTTNNRAELTAVIEGLLALNRSTAITVFSDSEYVCKGATSWLPQWQRNGWRTREGEVANRDLWQQIATARTIHAVRFQWVAGHKTRYRHCDWDGEEPEGTRAPVTCPSCGERATPYAAYPLNARCDSLAGDERRAMFEMAALRRENPEWTMHLCPRCAGTVWGPMGATYCDLGHELVQMVAAEKVA
jgi:ribonuclease HI